ncbi:MAG: ion transporter [Crocinitomicaceae bacterium]
MSDLENKKDLKPWQHQLNEIIFGSETRAGKWFDIILLMIIIFSVLAIMLDSIPGFHEKWAAELFIFEWVVTIIFTVEYILRLICVGKPLKYVFSVYGLIDLISLLPTYVGIFVSGTSSLRILRSFRLIRIFRILKLSQFVEDSKKLTNALRQSRNKIIVFLFFIVMMVISLGTVMYIVEGGEAGFTSIPRSIYWAIVTMTTVGYGDIAPATPLGQFIASVIMILGYAIIAVPTGIVTNDFIQGNKSKAMNNIACDNCGKDGHDMDAKYCNHCGQKL